MVGNTNTLAAALCGSIVLHAAGLIALDDMWGDGVAGAPDSMAAPALMKVSLHATASIDSRTPKSVPVPPAMPSAAMPGDATSGRVRLPRYYAADELDRRPKLLFEVPLVYPPELPTIRQGRAVLVLLIDETGKVDDVFVESADLPEALQALASSVFSKARFAPGQREGRAVKSRLKIEVTFETEEAKVPAQESSR
jgi:protein TonB